MGKNPSSHFQSPQPLPFIPQHTDHGFYKFCYTPQVFEAASIACHWLGRAFSCHIARGIGWIYAMTHRSIRLTVERNLQLLFPTPIPPHLATSVFTHFAATLADYLTLRHADLAQAASLLTPSSLETTHPTADPFTLLHSLLQEGRGGILVTGHFGFFELGSLFLKQRGIPLTILTYPEPSTALTQWRAAFRQRWGAQTLEMQTFSAFKILELLKAQELVAMLIDRPIKSPRSNKPNSDTHTLSVPLPSGHSIPFTQSPALLAYLADCPIIPITLKQTPHRGYQLTCKPGIWPRRLGLERTAAIEEATRQSAQALIAEFIQNPEQWYHFVDLQRR